MSWIMDMLNSNTVLRSGNSRIPGGKKFTRKCSLQIRKRIRLRNCLRKIMGGGYPIPGTDTIRHLPGSLM